MLWALLFSPLIIMLACAYFNDQKRKKKYRLEQLDLTTKHLSQIGHEKKAIISTRMDPP
ncbi:MAG TPA: hypothetical protein VE710_25350 [Candidatus Bathyarchaeia archaeon]|nr:hypothetical protein [Candidatus Bathyarchaeia archaeon]